MKKILMIEDEPYTDLKRRLEAKGHAVLWVTRVSDARDAMSRGPFDHVIIDVLLPAPDDSPDPDREAEVMGIILCKELLTHQWARGNITVWTAVSEDDFRERAKEMGLKL